MADIAKAGIVEFVPKTDSAFQSLLRWLEDIYADYSETAFEESLTRYFTITDRCKLPNSGRVLYSVIRLAG